MTTTISSGTNPYKLGSPPDFGTLYSGRALDFDGVTDYVNIGKPVLGSSFTYAVWISPDNVSSTGNIIGNHHGGGNETFLRQSSAALVFQLYISSETLITSSNVLTAGNWHYVVAVYDSGATHKIYVDGVEVGSGTAPTGSISTEDFIIGARFADTGDYFDGKASNVQIWDKAWSEDDVQYAYTHPEKLITDNSAVTSDITVSNLKAWYPCTEGNPRSPQTTVYDGSGDGNHGTTTFYGDMTDLIADDASNGANLYNTDNTEFDFTQESTAFSGAGSSYDVLANSLFTGTSCTALMSTSNASTGLEIANTTTAKGEMRSGAITTVAGSTYKLRTTHYDTSDSSAFVDADVLILAGKTAGGTDYLNYSNEDGATNQTFVATGTTLHISIGVDSTTSGHAVRIKTLQLREVGVATGWTTADAEPLIPQTALMGMSKPMVFDGIDDVVPTGFSGTAQDQTVSFWAMATETDDNRTVFGYGSTEKGAFGFNVSNKPFLKMGGNQFTYWVDTSAQDDGKLHHWMVFMDISNDAGCKLYVDGSLIAVSSTGSDETTTAWGSLFIGSEAGSSGKFMEGYINELAIQTGDTTGNAVTYFNDGVPYDMTDEDNLIKYYRNNGATWTEVVGGTTITATGSPDTILLPEGTTSGKDILGFPLTHPNNGWLNLDGSEYVDIGNSSVLIFQVVGLSLLNAGLN
jgi:hypothetical protein